MIGGGGGGGERVGERSSGRHSGKPAQFLLRHNPCRRVGGEVLSWASEICCRTSLTALNRVPQQRKPCRLMCLYHRKAFGFIWRCGFDDGSSIFHWQCGCYDEDRRREKTGIEEGSAVFISVIRKCIPEEGETFESMGLFMGPGWQRKRK